MIPGALNEWGRIASLVVKHPREGFRDARRIAGEWRALNFTAAPDFDRACEEYDAFLAALADGDATVHRLPDASGAGLDSIYVRDASVLVPSGVVLARMGKSARLAEPDAQAETFAALDVPIAGRIEPPGQLEGGDVVWFDERTLAVGRGYRTNDAGIDQLRSLAGADVDVIVVPLPHWRGPTDVFHLMSIVSPVDRDLAVVYPRLLPVPFRERLLDLGITFVDVPDEEFDSMGANVLAIAPRVCVMLDGNPVTRARLERAGARVVVYQGTEISLKGGGGPTCLTRPLARHL
jgi:N-dimethylarginine dimethylaminohydrolase